VDHETGRTWQTVSPVTGETDQVLVAGSGTPYPLVSGAVFLQHAPVAGVTAVSVRTAYPNDQLVPLDPSAWELLDPAHGVLTIAAGYGWCVSLLAVVDYTFADAVPADIAYAATLIAAGIVDAQSSVADASGFAAANPQLAGLDSIAVGQNDVSVKLSKPPSPGDAGAFAGPGTAVRAILDGYRRVVIA
jgi:hypothetical protein